MKLNKEQIENLKVVLKLADERYENMLLHESHDMDMDKGIRIEDAIDQLKTLIEK